jgi:oxygen-independent coproporphyrinogen-3 oxidase
MSSVAGGDRSGRWLADPGFGVYVHIPFCKHRCHYCDFNTYQGRDDLHDAYIDALEKEIRTWSGPARRATSVFFGGGTPTLLPAEQLGRILDAIGDVIDIEPGAEVTVESNPETVDRAYFERLLRQGFNRVSIGVQSLVGRVLEGLGRTHTAATATGAIAAAREAGFEDINADLIYGSAWETDGDWARSLEGVLAAGTHHISAYALTVEEGTPLATLIDTKRVPDVDPDVQAARYEVAEEVLGAAGFHRYEVSNWARPGRASRHNVLYWSGGDYLGFGAGAHAHAGGRRWWATRLPRDYIAAVDAAASTEAGAETLAPDARLGEALMLGLRLSTGVDLDAIAARHGPAALSGRLETIDSLVTSGLLRRDGPWLRLAPDATLLANDVLCRLV